MCDTNKIKKFQHKKIKIQRKKNEECFLLSPKHINNTNILKGRKRQINTKKKYNYGRGRVPRSNGRK